MVESSAASSHVSLQLVHAINGGEAICRDAEVVMKLEKGVMYSRIWIVGCGVTE